MKRLVARAHDRDIIYARIGYTHVKDRDDMKKYLEQILTMSKGEDCYAKLDNYRWMEETYEHVIDDKKADFYIKDDLYKKYFAGCSLEDYHIRLYLFNHR